MQQMAPKETKKNFYFIGIAGTGMAATAGLLKEAGHNVEGSDEGIYPPMSTMLEEYQIPVQTPYQAENLTGRKPDYAVVSNALSREHAEVKKAQSLGIELVSYPQVLGEFFLKDSTSLVITGTHGKTTTTSLVVHLLDSLGQKPSYLIGGVPKGKSKSFAYSGEKLFVIEGDEYDTAFFDKESKFLHYCPDYIIFNNLEFDHADIFANLDAIKVMFRKLFRKMTNPAGIIANCSDPQVVALLKEEQLYDKVTRVFLSGEPKGAGLLHKSYFKEEKWWHEIEISGHGKQLFSTALAGSFNGANITMALTLLMCLYRDGHIKTLPLLAVQNAVANFAGVRKRMDFLGTLGGVSVFEDFAHHPTAVRTVLENFRTANAGKRIIAAFEPKNATSRRNVFSDSYAKSLDVADLVLLAPCVQDSRIPIEQRMDTEKLSQSIGLKAIAFKDHQELLGWLKGNCQAGDAILFMSSGDFAGIPRQFLKQT